MKEDKKRYLRENYRRGKSFESQGTKKMNGDNAHKDTIHEDIHVKDKDVPFEGD